MEQKAESGQGQEGNPHIDQEPLGFTTGRARRHGFPQAGTVFPDHRKDGSELDDDLEDLAGLIVEVEQITRQDQVAS